MKKNKVDVLAHFLVPEMKVLSEGEKKKVMEKYRLKEWQFPKFLSSDPAVVALGAKPGDLIRIKREDITGVHTEYRIVIKGKG